MHIILIKKKVNHSFSGFKNYICVLIRTESTVLIRSGYSFVAIEVKVKKYNKTVNIRSLGILGDLGAVSLDDRMFVMKVTAFTTNILSSLLRLPLGLQGCLVPRTEK